LRRAIGISKRPSALSAGLTGRAPRYGYHLDEHRQATLLVASELHAARN